jgi:hypothetical protein
MWRDLAGFYRQGTTTSLDGELAAEAACHVRMRLGMRGSRNEHDARVESGGRRQPAEGRQTARRRCHAICHAHGLEESRTALATCRPCGKLDVLITPPRSVQLTRNIPTLAFSTETKSLAGRVRSQIEEPKGMRGRSERSRDRATAPRRGHKARQRANAHCRTVLVTAQRAYPARRSPPPRTREHHDRWGTIMRPHVAARPTSRTAYRAFAVAQECQPPDGDGARTSCPQYT